MHYGVPNDAALVAVLVFALFAAVLAVIAERTHFFPRAVRWIQKDPVVRTALVVLLFAIGPITARTKNGQMSLPRPPLLLQVVEPPPEPATAPVSVWTNGVALRPESTTAVEITAFRKVGGTEIGDWIEVAEPFFAIGTNPVSRCYVSASGSVSFESMRRPPVGSSLPDGTGLPVLCPLRAHLGMVPEANWTSASVQSRFWHNAIPGGGRVLTWEDALLDRQSGRRVSFQVELHPTGDFIYRYDFGDALAPAATNLVIGAQAGTNAVNALAVLGTNTLSATLWRVGNTLVTNGVAIADLLCSNGVLRTPATFAMSWKNLAPCGDLALDPDGDGISSHDEIFLYNTDPLVADTDADGIADNVELMMGMDPLDADEDGDGIPDGVLAASWTANSLWASNSADGVIVTVSLRSVIPAGAAATFVLDDLAIPLRSPASWSFAFEPGIAHNYRLFVTHGATADLSITTVPPNPVRGSEESFPLWAEGDGGVFDGPSNGGSGKAAVPDIVFSWNVPEGSAHLSNGGLCLHGGTEADFTPDVLPAEIGAEWVLENLQDVGGGALRLSVPTEGEVVNGAASLVGEKLREGSLTAHFSAHVCDASAPSPFCSVCGCYVPLDAYLDLSHATLTLKYDNELFLALLHPRSPGVEYTDVQFEVCQPGYGGWQPISGSVWTARIAGTFAVRGTAVVDGTDVVVGPVNVWVQFPAETQMMADHAIQSHAVSLWAQTLALCTETNRHEVGCWIRLDTATGAYSFTPMVIGDPTPNDQASNINLLPLPVDSPLFPRLSSGSAVYTVASLHTHTPTTYRSGNPRIAGPSTADENASTGLSMPGLVYDYVDSSISPGMIPMGHPLHAATRLYPTAVCPRRIHP